MTEILILKKENILPDWRFFKKINNFLWNKGLKKAEKLVKKKSILIIGDQESCEYFHKRNIPCRNFTDYLGKFNDTYPLALSLIQKWLNSRFFDEIRKYKSFDLGKIVEEEFAYILEPLFVYIEVLETIIKKEHPDKITIIGEFGLINKTIECVGKTNKIKINKISNIGSLRNFADKLIKNISFRIRFYNTPWINRREFVKTKKEVNESLAKNILVLGLDNLYLNRLGNIPDMLKRKNMAFFNLCTNLDTQEKLESKSMKYFSFGDFLDKNIKSEMEARKKLLSAHWANLKKDQKFKKIFNCRGIDLFCILSKEIEYLVKIKLLWVAYYLATAEKCLNSQKVNFVVSACDAIAVTRGIISLAKKEKIPSLVIQNGVTAGPSGRGFIPLIADKIAVWGEVSKKFMIERGTEPERVAITGNPQESQFKSLDINGLYKKYPIDKNKKIILLGTQVSENLFYEKEFSNLTYNLIEFLEDNKDMQLVIKLHPREKREIYESILKETNAKNVIIINDYLQEILSVSEVLITLNSTIILDALKLGKPVIVSNFLKRPCSIPYAQSGAVINTENKEELINALKNFQKLKPDKKIVERFLKYCNYKDDGKAGERIISLIKTEILAKCLIIKK